MGSLSFGRRLTLFFLLIVVLPMLAVAGLLLTVTAESRSGKADARLAAGLGTALQLDNEQVARAQVVAARLAKDPALSAALRSGRPAALAAVAKRLASEAGIVAVSIQGPSGVELAKAGDPAAVGFAEVQLQQNSGPLGMLRVSVTPASAYVDRIATLTGADAVVLAGGRELAGTVKPPPSSIPAVGATKEINLNGTTKRARTVDLQNGGSLVLLGPTDSTGLPINLRVAILLLTLLAIAVTFTFYLARTMHDLHELTSQQAVTDELTGLSNARRFRELLAKEAERAKRFSHQLSLLMLDLDDFKRVNDSHGHLQGDDVLREVAKTIQDATRGVDEPARYGGEEFAVALPETDPVGALELAERIRSRIEELKVPLRGGRGSTGVTVSIGVAGLSRSVNDPDALIAAADSALYEAKGAGKNQVASGAARRRKAAQKRTRLRGKR